MSDIQKSPSLNQMVDAFTHLKQRVEYFERHIQNSNNQEIRKEYFRTLAQVIEAENDDDYRCPICDSRIDEFGYCACGGNLGVG